MRITKLRSGDSAYAVFLAVQEGKPQAGASLQGVSASGLCAAHGVRDIRADIGQGCAWWNGYTRCMWRCRAARKNPAWIIRPYLEAIL